MRKIIIILLVLGVFVWWFRPSGPEIKNVHNAFGPVVVFGDSLTAGTGAGREKSYPALLGRKISRPVINMGLPGDTAAAAPARLSQVLEHRPYMVLIEFGGNDFMRGVPITQTEAAVRQMVDAVQAAGAVAVVVDTGGYAGMAPYSKIYKQIAAEKGAVFVPAILDGIFTKNKFKADPIHPNAAGYEIVAERVHKAIQPYL